MRLAGAVALGSAAAIGLILAAAPASGGPAALTPDLVTLAIGERDLVVERDGSRTLLRLSNEIANRANGPLEVFPGAISADCDGDGDPANDRDASQRIFADSDGSGGYGAGIDLVDSERPFGCMRYHPAHDHWHVLDIARYELRREGSGKLVARSRKLGFCLTDTRLVYPGPGSPPVATYPLGSAKPIGCDATSIQGISAGWADLYAFVLPGQELEITGLRRGRYCLLALADPLDAITELDEANNLRRARIALRPRLPSVRRLDGPCRLK